jgi:hypothetical protein
VSGAIGGLRGGRTGLVPDSISQVSSGGLIGASARGSGAVRSGSRCSPRRVLRRSPRHFSWRLPWRSPQCSMQGLWGQIIKMRAGSGLFLLRCYVVASLPRYINPLLGRLWAVFE